MERASATRPPARPERTRAGRIARLVLMCAMLGLLLPAPVAEAELGVGEATLNLTCLSESSCLLDNEATGLDSISRQESAATPLNPVVVRLEFQMAPDQRQMSLLPPTLDELVIDLIVREDVGGLVAPDIVVDLRLGPSQNQWTIPADTTLTQQQGRYHIENEELNLDRGRLLRPGNPVSLTLSFEIDQPVTWELRLRSDSWLTLPVEWSADVDSANIDEPSSAGNPVELEMVEQIQQGALLDADQDCYTFPIEDNVEALTLHVSWKSVPLEIEQPHTPPDLIREGGNSPRNPAVKTSYEGGETVSEIRYDEPPKGEYLACWTGLSNHFQAYSWFGRLSYEGIGSTSPSDFSGDANWISGQAQVGSSDEFQQFGGAGVFTLLLALLGTGAGISGLAFASNNRWSKRVLIPLALVLLVVGGIASPIWAMTDEAPRAREVLLDDLIEARLAGIERAGLDGGHAAAVSGMFGVKPGENLRLRLHVVGAHPTDDGRWQVHVEELEQVRLDNYVFGYLKDNPMTDIDKVRFILAAGRLLTLDLLMLEALLIVDEPPEGELLHIDWSMAAANGAGTAADPVWTSRPDSISLTDWTRLQNDLYPILLTISYCDCGIDGMEVSYMGNSRLDAGSVPSSEGIEVADGFVAKEGMWVTGGILLLLAAGGIEWYRLRQTQELSEKMFR